MTNPDMVIRLCNHRKKTLNWSRGQTIFWKDDKDYKAPKNLEALKEYIALIHQTLEESWNNKYHYYNRAKEI